MTIKTKTLLVIIILMISAAFIMPQTLGETDSEVGMNYLNNKESEKAVKSFEYVLLKQHLNNKRTEQLLIKAKKQHIQQETLKINQAFQKGNFEKVKNDAQILLDKYQDDVLIGGLTEKVSYLQIKAQSSY